MTVEGKVPSVLNWALYHEDCWRQEVVAMYAMYEKNPRPESLICACVKKRRPARHYSVGQAGTYEA
jgi:hypothetical protein